MKSKTSLFAVFIIAICVPALFHYYPSEKVFIFEKFFFCFFVFPYLFSMLLHKGFFTQGLKIVNIKEGTKLMCAFFALYLPTYFIYVNNKSVIQYYGALSIQDFASSQWQNVLEIFSSEYFFRGFLLLSLVRYFNPGEAIMMQGVVYSILHIGKPLIECLGSVPVGIALGYLAVKTESIWYGVVLHYVYGGFLLDISRLRF